MTVLVDGLKAYPRRRLMYCHMVSDKSLKELHEFARNIGVARHWFERGHYDLNSVNRLMALNAGAEEVTTRELARRCATRGKKWE